MGENKEHKCHENFEHYLAHGRQFEFDYSDETVLFYGKCSVCGKKLIERFDFTDVVDRKTSKRISDISALEELKLAYRHMMASRGGNWEMKYYIKFMEICRKLLK